MPAPWITSVCSLLDELDRDSTLSLAEEGRGDVLEAAFRELTGLSIPILSLYPWYHAEAVVTDANVKHVIPELLPCLLGALAGLQQDPQPLMSLIDRLVDPLSFSETLVYCSSEALIRALESNVPSVMYLALRIIGKATRSCSDAAQVAGMNKLVAQFVTTWLSTPDIGVSDTASKVIVALLRVDHETSPIGEVLADTGLNASEELSRQGQRLLWRRIFSDRDVYRIFFTHCGIEKDGEISQDIGAPGYRCKRSLSLAQARLLHVLPQLAQIDFELLNRPISLESERMWLNASYGLADHEGLIDFAALHMIDHDDVLLQPHYFDFLEKLIRGGGTARPDQGLSLDLTAPCNTSAQLEYLVSRKLHRSMLMYCCNIHETEQLQVGNPAVTYLSSYAMYYPMHLMNTTIETVPGQTMKVINLLLSYLRARCVLVGRRGSDMVPDLFLLNSLPRVSLITCAYETATSTATSTALSLDRWSGASPIAFLSTKSGQHKIEMYTTLGNVFGGRGTLTTRPNMTTDDEIVGMGSVPGLGSEAAAARALYLLYSTCHPDFFKDLVQDASIIALTDVALSAQSCLYSLVTALWDPLSDTQVGLIANTSLPLETDLVRAIYARVEDNRVKPLPMTGIAAITSPPAVYCVLPFLCSPFPAVTQQISSSMRNRDGGALNTLYKARYDTLLAFHEGLRKEEGVSVHIRDAIEQALKDWKFRESHGHGQGSSLATLGH